MAPNLHLVHSERSPMKAVLAMADKIAETGTNSLIVGETGLGKRALALHILGCGPRATAKVVAVHCDGASERELERTLFGAIADHDQTPGSPAVTPLTLFIGAIDGLSPRLQARLMHDLAIAGSTDPSNPNRAMRVIATTTRDLVELAAAHRFRQDLLDLLTCPISIPPLRARRTDIAELMRACWAEIGASGELTSAALEVVARQEWPGNVRQLKAFAIRLRMAAPTPVVGAADIWRALRLVPAAEGAAGTGTQRESPAPALDGEELVEQIRIIGIQAVLTNLEASLIDWALAQTNGRRHAAAELLGLKRTTLVEKLRRRAA
jgi:sigma-54 specific flagellar transcriptional regulator A